MSKIHKSVYPCHPSYLAHHPHNNSSDTTTENQLTQFIGALLTQLAVRHKEAHRAIESAHQTLATRPVLVGGRHVSLELLVQTQIADVDELEGVGAARAPPEPRHGGRLQHRLPHLVPPALLAHPLPAARAQHLCKSQSNVTHQSLQQK
jgi:hypothetical protein